MTNQPNNVLAGKARATGGVFVAPLATALPADAATALAVGYVHLGLVSESGLTRTIDRSTTAWKDWNKETFRTITTEHTVMYKLTLLESATLAVLQEVFGAENVTQVDNLITIKHNSSSRTPRRWVFDMIDGFSAVREVVPNGQIVTAASETVFDTENPISFDIEIEAMVVPGSDTKAYSYIEKDAFIPAE